MVTVAGVSGVSLGVQYANTATLADGVGCDVFSYTACSDLEYPNSPDGNVAHEFPYSGGGNRLIWVRTSNCQRHEVDSWGVQVVVCAFYVYAYAFGELFTQSLFAVQDQFGDEFEPMYLDLLRAGGSKSAVELMKPFGLDPRDPTSGPLKPIEDAPGSYVRTRP